MGGREFELHVDGLTLKVRNEAALEVIWHRIAVLPKITEGCGPYPGCKSGRTGVGPDKPELPFVAVSY